MRETGECSSKIECLLLSSVLILGDLAYPLSPIVHHRLFLKNESYTMTAAKVPFALAINRTARDSISSVSISPQFYVFHCSSKFYRESLKYLFFCTDCLESSNKPLRL